MRSRESWTGSAARRGRAVAMLSCSPIPTRAGRSTRRRSAALPQGAQGCTACAVASLPRSAPHVRYGDGRHWRSHADLAGVDGGSGHRDNPALRGLLAERTRVGVRGGGLWVRVATADRLRRRRSDGAQKCRLRIGLAAASWPPTCSSWSSGRASALSNTRSCSSHCAMVAGARRAPSITPTVRASTTSTRTSAWRSSLPASRMAR